MNNLSYTISPQKAIGIMSKKSWGFVVLSFVLILGVFIAFVLTRPKTPFMIQTTFAEGLIYNDMDKLRSITSPEKWPFLDNWEKIHDPVPRNCKYPSDPDVNTTGVGRFDEGTGQDVTSLIIGRECPDDFYFITLDDVTVVEIDGNWVVISWGEYCDSSQKRKLWCYRFNYLRE